MGIFHNKIKKALKGKETDEERLKKVLQKQRKEGDIVLERWNRGQAYSDARAETIAEDPTIEAF